jgi:hypothetical protein
MNNNTIPERVSDEESQRLVAEAEKLHEAQLAKIQKAATQSAALHAQATNK